MNKDEILKQGYIDVKVQVQGLRQSHRLSVEKEKTPRGILTYLVSKHYIPTNELVRLAEVLQLPIKHNATVVFPKGKMPKDFIENQEISVQAETVEAELED
jgi:hypothetical protein